VVEVDNLAQRPAKSAMTLKRPGAQARRLTPPRVYENPGVLSAAG